jgi:sugar phosphate isomerase/epimerase
VSEARSLGCVLAKCGLGTLSALDPRTLEELRDALAACEQAAPGVALSVENDQLPSSGRLDLWTRLFDATHAGGHTTGMTFDVGNWACVGVDVMAAARALGSQVRYVHVKGVKPVGDRWQSVPVRPAGTVYPALTAMRADVPRAIEYPLIGADADTDARTDVDYITATASAAVALVRSGNFTL